MDWGRCGISGDGGGTGTDGGKGGDGVDMEVVDVI